ncbi:hypothetical protein DSO57_1022351 [Entomophthora muscae]|uniref:Uncharacterized protein n=1 Tax=Entomophthora muscae TaxID=34485 RepID=A0ACC2SSA0_9FUNG|nr:hypothetical protein DSO57_1022351 [Entomophthora muscae]
MIQLQTLTTIISIIKVSAFTALDQEIMEAQMSFSFQEELSNILKKTPKAVAVNNQEISYLLLKAI